MDLISCRNMLIYLQPQAQNTVLSLFHFSLKPGGFLFLGSSESPGALIDEFDTIDEHAKIYRKRRDVRLPRDLRLPLAAQRRPCPSARAPMRAPRRANPLLLAIYDRLLDRFMPPSFLVDEHGQLVDTFGGAERCSRSAAAAVAEPARYARRRAAHGASPARCSASGAISRASATRRSRLRRSALHRSSPSRCAIRTAR